MLAQRFANNYFVIYYDDFPILYFDCWNELIEKTHLRAKDFSRRFKENEYFINIIVDGKICQLYRFI